MVQSFVYSKSGLTCPDALYVSNILYGYSGMRMCDILSLILPSFRIAWRPSSVVCLPVPSSGHSWALESLGKTEAFNAARALAPAVSRDLSLNYRPPMENKKATRHFGVVVSLGNGRCGCERVLHPYSTNALQCDRRHGRGCQSLWKK